jgi:alkyl sulfatase BDS1-like metallo-beta-lactamase superfamily hydrolase
MVSEAESRARGIPVIAPEGFLEEAFSETMLAGVPMRRRSLFQFGTTLPPGPMGHVDSGLGKAVGRGRDGLIPPNRLIREPSERHVIDGVEFVFHLTPGTEAPAEMNIVLPSLRALNLAENACHTMHNLCPLRGAKTRDALSWSRYLDEALHRFVPEVDVVCAQHQWPVWGTTRIHEFVAGQRDLYRYLHDQTLRLMSHGLTPAEIGERLLLPNRLSRQWFARGYYGAVVHNVAAIYTHYLGPYDGNPANLHPLQPQDEGARYVACMGGAEAVMQHARQACEAGDFRWAVQLLKHLVFSQPDHREARELHADAMEQLGYQAESATWRNAYLLGAQELRAPRRKAAHATIPISADMVALLPLGKFLEFLAIRVDGERAQDLQARFNWTLLDADGEHTPGTVEGDGVAKPDGTEASQHQAVTLSNGALSHLPGVHTGAVDAHIVTLRSQLLHLMQGAGPALRALDEGLIRCDGDRALVRAFLQTLDVFDPMFNVVEP